MKQPKKKFEPAAKPRTDLLGEVRIQISLFTEHGQYICGNLSSVIRLKHTRVSEVHAAIQEALFGAEAPKEEGCV